MITKLPILVLCAISALSTLAPSDLVAADRGNKQSKQEKPWIHIEVHEAGEETASVMVNLPLNLARTALELAPDSVMSGGQIKIEGAEFTVEDMRKIWAELRQSGDAEFLTVEEKEATVKVSRKGDRLYINVDDRKSDEQVRVEIPVTLVDALLRGSGNTLNVDAAVAELEKMGKGEIVRVDGTDESVRIWIE